MIAIVQKLGKKKQSNTKSANKVHVTQVKKIKIRTSHNRVLRVCNKDYK